MKSSDLSVGQGVQIFKGGIWRSARISKIGRVWVYIETSYGFDVIRFGRPEAYHIETQRLKDSFTGRFRTAQQADEEGSRILALKALRDNFDIEIKDDLRNAKWSTRELSALLGAAHTIKSAPSA